MIFLVFLRLPNKHKLKKHIKNLHFVFILIKIMFKVCIILRRI